MFSCRCRVRCTETSLRLRSADPTMNDVLATLAATIKARRTAQAEASYTRQLLDKGPEKCARKFGEEALETVIAGVSQSKEDLTSEAADVLYHLLVLLESRDVAWTDVLAKLEDRSGTSGVAEKASRPAT